MINNKENNIIIGVDLVDLGIAYLQKHHQPATGVHLLCAMEKILKRVELINRSGPKIRFAGGRIIAAEKINGKSWR